MVTGMGLVLLTAVWAQAQTVDYAAAVAAAQKERDLAALNRLCNEWIEAKPTDDRPRLILGRLLLKLDKIDQAVEQFELAAEANPLSAAPACEIGNVFLKARKYEEALKEYDQALQINRKHVPALVGKARAKLAQGAPEAALVDARQAQQYGPDDASANAILGEVLLATGATEDALDVAQKATELNAGNADAWYGLGMCLDTLGRADQAQAAWERFLGVEADGDRATRVRHGWVVLDTTLLHPELKRDGLCGAVSPDGKHVAIVVAKRGVFRVPLLSDQELMPVALFPDDCAQQRRVSWSPDGSELLYYEALREAGKFRARRVGAAGGQAPASIELPGVKNLTYPAWSPSGKEILIGIRPKYALNALTGKARRIAIRNVAGKELTCHDGTCLPDGKEAVVAGALPGQGWDILRVTLETGEATVVWNCGKMFPAAVVTSPDGSCVAATLWTRNQDAAWPIMLVSCSVAGVAADMGICRHPYGGASWFPDGRRFMVRVNDFGHERLAILRLGGLDHRPVGITIERAEDGALSAVVASKSDVSQTVGLRWEAFDDQSLRLGPATESPEPVELKPGERVEWPIELTDEQAKSAVTVKVTVLNQDGIGAVKLVDWAEGQK